jgi:hypothetical protein
MIDEFVFIVLLIFATVIGVFIGVEVTNRNQIDSISSVNSSGATIVFSKKNPEFTLNIISKKER